METKVQIHKLNNENYSAWSYKMKLILIKERVWKAVSEDIPTDASEVTTWTPPDQLAQALIGLNVEDNQLLHIRNAANAKEAWETLKDIHEHDSVTNIVTLIRKMYATQMPEELTNSSRQNPRFIPKNRSHRRKNQRYDENWNHFKQSPTVMEQLSNHSQC